MAAANDAEQPGPTVRLQVVRGDASPEEIAVLVAVLAARPVAGAGDAPRRLPAWQDRRRSLRTPLHHGPGGWRASGLPR